MLTFKKQNSTQWSNIKYAKEQNHYCESWKIKVKTQSIYHAFPIESALKVIKI